MSYIQTAEKQYFYEPQPHTLQGLLCTAPQLQKFGLHPRQRWVKQMETKSLDQSGFNHSTQPKKGLTIPPKNLSQFHHQFPLWGAPVVPFSGVDQTQPLAEQAPYFSRPNNFFPILNKSPSNRLDDLSTSSAAKPVFPPPRIHFIQQLGF